MPRAAIGPARGHLAALLEMPGGPEPQRFAERRRRAAPRDQAAPRRPRQPQRASAPTRSRGPRGSARARAHQRSRPSSAPSRRAHAATTSSTAMSSMHGAPRRHCRLWRQTHVAARDTDTSADPTGPLRSGHVGPNSADDRRAHRRGDVQRAGVAGHHQRARRASASRSAQRRRRRRRRRAPLRRARRPRSAQLALAAAPRSRRSAGRSALAEPRPPARRSARAASACSATPRRD